MHDSKLSENERYLIKQANEPKVAQWCVKGKLKQWLREKFVELRLKRDAKTKKRRV